MHDALAARLAFKLAFIFSDTTAVGLVAALAGCSGAVVALILGRRKAAAETTGIAIETADRLVALLRADMERVRADMAQLRADLDVAIRHVAECEQQLAVLRHRTAEGLGDLR